LRLAGDTEDFDNRVATAPPPETRLTVLHFGQDGADDPRQPLFFLRRAMPRTPRLTVDVTAVPPAGPVPSDALTKTGFIVITGPVDAAVATAVRTRLEEGATALVALNGPEMGDTLSALAGVGSCTLEDVTPPTYAMFGEIDFRHPVFAPFADPRFSDFTKIRFQKYRRLDPSTLAGFRVPARFDSGDPALLETDAERGRLGETDAERGRLVVLTSGWVAADSQLAVSSKFPALLASLLDWSGATALAPTSFVTGDSIPRLALGAPDGVAVSVRTPGGSTQALAAEAVAFGGTDEPGLYQATVGESTRLIPVTLEPAESRTAPLTVDDLEKLGVPLAQAADRAQAAAARAALPAAAVAESRQKLWRWILLAALGVLLLETVLAGRAARRATTPAEAAP